MNCSPFPDPATINGGGGGVTSGGGGGVSACAPAAAAIDGNQDSPSCVVLTKLFTGNALFAAHTFSTGTPLMGVALKKKVQQINEQQNTLIHVLTTPCHPLCRDGLPYPQCIAQRVEVVCNTLTGVKKRIVFVTDATTFADFQFMVVTEFGIPIDSQKMIAMGCKAGTFVDYTADKLPKWATQLVLVDKRVKMVVHVWKDFSQAAPLFIVPDLKFGATVADVKAGLSKLTQLPPDRIGLKNMEGMYLAPNAPLFGHTKMHVALAPPDDNNHAKKIGDFSFVAVPKVINRRHRLTFSFTLQHPTLLVPTDGQHEPRTETTFVVNATTGQCVQQYLCEIGDVIGNAEWPLKCTCAFNDVIMQPGQRLTSNMPEHCLGKSPCAKKPEFVVTFENQDKELLPHSAHASAIENLGTAATINIRLP
ncbi:hypothetical protein OAM67_00295 [bacterium]|nr:hypothetical protein [bacterium]